MSETRQTSDAPQEIEGYRVIRAIDAHAFLAEDLTLHRAIVLRFFSPPFARARDVASAEDDQVRFELAGILGSIAHPRIARIFRVGAWSGQPFLVAEHVAGESLEVLAQKGELEIDRLRELGRALAEAVAEIHRLGVFHGELSAATVVIGAAGELNISAPFPALSPRISRAICAARRARDASSPTTPIPRSGATPPVTDLDPEIAAGQRRDVLAIVEILRLLAGSRLIGGAVDRWISSGSPPASLRAGELATALAAIPPESGAGDSGGERPYRGLLPYQVEHSGMFFGRSAEIRELLERLSVEPWVVVAGTSGSGKSSLVRAGLAPPIERGALPERDRWDVVTIVPGASPIDALAEALQPIFPGDQLQAQRLAAEPDLLAYLCETRERSGLLLIVDQLEEIFTLAGKADRETLLRVLAPFRALAPGRRLVITVRSDFLPALLELPMLGRDVARATFVLQNMTREALREAIDAPAARLGVRFESPQMIEQLAKEAAESASGLPLLSFVLSELWDRRDRVKRVIPAAALAELSGVNGALAFHAEHTLASLTPAEREAAQRILLGLVGPHGMRARRLQSELVKRGDGAARRALEVLIERRLIVAGARGAGKTELDISHETLLRSWPRLAQWIEDQSEVHAAARRLRSGAREWQQLGRVEEALWSERRLGEVTNEVLELAALEGEAEAPVQTFVRESRRVMEEARRRKRRRWIALAVSPLVIAAAVILGIARLRAADLERRIARGTAALAEARRVESAHEALAREALALFERDEETRAELAWTRALAEERAVESARRELMEALERLLAVAPDHEGARAIARHVLRAQFLSAERRGQQALARALRARIELDTAGDTAWLEAPAKLIARTSPAAQLLSLEVVRADERGRAITSSVAVSSSGALSISIAPGSYLLRAKLAAYADTVLPLRVSRGADLAVTLELVPASSVPEGFVYVPRGLFLYGSRGAEDMRKILDAHPEQELWSKAFLIAAREATRAELAVFLKTPPPPRDRAALPAGGVDHETARRYAAWLAETERVPGARLCTEREWERAARGADGRRYPHGESLADGDACTGSEDGPRNPCPAGTHPGSRSVFGIDDLVGGVWEWTADPPAHDQPTLGVLRGGSALEELDSPFLFAANRGIRPKSAVSDRFGIRICADLP